MSTGKHFVNTELHLGQINMASRTIQTTDLIEESISFLAKEANTDPDTFIMDKLSFLFTDLTQDATQKKYQKAIKILESKDPAKVISSLKDLLS